ncbi:F-box protein At4g00755-like isoform X2 [Henckelia pumila]|uniref:F-box protein At4g00755-like isoform X2 n=1 Tax=Henckelia pumila TaxID=405737 RepID=UPI003C6E60C9
MRSKLMDHKKVEITTDFLQCLETDMSVHVMSFLDDPADVVRASAISHFWRHFVITNGLAKKLCLKCFPQLSNIVGVIDAGEESIDSVEAEMSDAMKWKILERDHHAYASLHQALTKSNVSSKDCISNAISASSTDNYPDESVVNTLNPRDRFIRRASYWSSKGQSDPAASETLIYKLRDGIWVITEIDIQPFEAFFQAGKPIYSAKFVRFRVGYPKNPNEIEKDASQTSADDKFIWSYTSRRFPMTQENRLQPFKLEEPVLCIGGYLQIELLGRVQTQELDGLFYICICYVRVLGRPLFPAFDVEPVEPYRKFLLKHYPKNLIFALQSSPSNEIPTMRRYEEEMLWERIGLLENLLRGIQQGPNNPFIWDEDDDDINEGLIL